MVEGAQGRHVDGFREVRTPKGQSGVGRFRLPRGRRLGRAEGVSPDAVVARRSARRPITSAYRGISRRSRAEVSRSCVATRLTCSRAAVVTAGHSLDRDRSENGNRTSTTAPLAGAPMPRPPQADSRQPSASAASLSHSVSGTRAAGRSSRMVTRARRAALGRTGSNSCTLLLVDHRLHRPNHGPPPPLNIPFKSTPAGEGDRARPALISGGSVGVRRRSPTPRHGYWRTRSPQAPAVSR
jgi:hypothetical protein